MINVYVQRASNERIDSFSMDGHADFAEHGQDIVCAGASAVSFGSINAIMALTEVEPIIEQSSDGGFLRCIIPDDIPQEADSKVQLLLNSMVISLQTIERDYSDFIKITFKK
ncbi:ribosomal-processing cysteine protease Prp [Rossellomorea aquimaris]|uniref:ribosomal-processing cysteine protease Prp n=1 Tax=Rossellomorea aquimaris TaxID=189382 RepID=UPI0007D0546E|nr:ribosomal-processing cysteine protease Prp [Rossellomorea aquimaris]